MSVRFFCFSSLNCYYPLPSLLYPCLTVLALHATYAMLAHSPVGAHMLANFALMEQSIQKKNGH